MVNVVAGHPLFASTVSSQHLHRDMSTNLPLRILTTSPIFGYGYRAEDFWAGIVDHKADAVIVDAGSTDGGPYKLGLGKMTCSRESYIRDFSPMLDACYHMGTKIIIGSAGGCGSDIQVDGFVEILTSILKEKRYHLKIATIKSNVEPSRVTESFKTGQIVPCGPAPNLTQKEIDNATVIVAQIGAEPFQKLLKEQPDVDIIIAGRCYDPAPFAALAMHYGVKDGIAWHCGKIMECGGICATPKARSMLATLHADSFVLTPLNDTERCTPVSVAAHALYEKTRPDILSGPGGNLLLSDVKYTQLADQKSVQVSGAIFQPVPYTVKLEAAEFVGYRTIFVGGIRDPILIDIIDEFLEDCAEYTGSLIPELRDGVARIIWHVYGKNAVMGPLETANTRPHELGIMGEVIAPTQALATSIANNVRVGCLHAPYEGQLATAGNFAIPLTPHEQECGAVFKFSIYHLMPCNEPENWPISVFDAGVSKEAAISKTQQFQPVVSKVVPKPRKLIKKVTNGATSHPNTLRYVAKVVRSKNAGPFEITFDVMFETPELFHHVKQTNVLTRELVKRLYKVEDSDILACMFFEPALAWKATIKRPWIQGSVGETDTLGTAQHAPLLDVEIPGL